MQSLTRSIAFDRMNEHVERFLLDFSTDPIASPRDEQLSKFEVLCMNVVHFFEQKEHKISTYLEFMFRIEETYLWRALRGFFNFARASIAESQPVYHLGSQTNETPEVQHFFNRLSKQRTAKAVFDTFPEFITFVESKFIANDPVWSISENTLSRSAKTIVQLIKLRNLINYKITESLTVQQEIARGNLINFAQEHGITVAEHEWVNLKEFKHKHITTKTTAEFDDVYPQMSPEIAFDLIAEMRALRRYPIPYGATVEISVPPFISMQFFENRYGIISTLCLTADNRYAVFDLADNMSTPMCMPMLICDELERIINPDDVPHLNRLHVATSTAIAGVLRDFAVIEDRRKVLGSPRQRNGKVKHLPPSQRIVYLPRARYSAHKAASAGDQLEHSSRREHWVAPFVRRLPDGWEPSVAQLEIAAAAGRYVPDRHTYVQGHERGTGAPGSIVYRSRSAVAAVVESFVTDHTDNDTITRLDLDEMARRYLEQSGWRIIQMIEDGPHGLEVRATNKDNIRLRARLLDSRDMPTAKTLLAKLQDADTDRRLLFHHQPLPGHIRRKIPAGIQAIDLATAKPEQRRRGRPRKAAALAPSA